MEELLMTDAGAAGAVIGFAAGTSLIIKFIWWVFKLIAAYKVMEKMDEPGWKSFIPLYHDFVLYKHVWSGGMGIAYIVLYILGEAFGATDVMALRLIGGLMLLVVFVISIIYSNRMAKAFGHGIGYTIGLIFLEPIFNLILGFGSDEYQGNPSEG